MTCCFGKVMTIKFIIAFTLFFGTLHAQDACAPTKQPFQAGEALTYEVQYNWGKLWTDAGSVTFSVDHGVLNTKPVYYFKGEGGTYPKYDWFFKVRDKYEAWSNLGSMKPYKFVRQVQEGSTVLYNHYAFDQEANTAEVKWFTSKRNQTGTDEIEYPECSFDVLSAIYYCRSIEFDQYEVNDTIPLTLILDKQVEKTWIRYTGKKVLTTREGKQVSCIVFQPLLIEGSIFSGGEEMQVWVSDDENKVPLYIESEIIIGTIKVYLTEATGLKVPKEY
jgi:hypothetical protein